MQYANIPGKMPIPWGANATSSYIRTVPNNSQTGVQPGAASFVDGFPPLCAVPVSAGGIPPFMQDFNGILNMMTQWLRWFQAGGPVIYDPVFQSAIGGYPNGAVVFSTNTVGLQWRSTVENNTTNPDAGGAGWVRAQSGKLQPVAPITANTTYYPSSGAVYMIDVTVVGGGGAGGGGYNTQGITAFGVGSGGASGGIIMGRFTSGFANGVSILIGAPGTPSPGAQGGNGGTSSFGALLTAPGGGGGGIAAVSAGSTIQAGQGAPGAAPTISGGTLLFAAAGQPGPNGIILPAGIVSGQGAPSPLGGGGGANTNISTGGSATGPGAGGGGGATPSNSAPTSGGSGGGGVVIITEYAG